MRKGIRDEVRGILQGIARELALIIREFGLTLLFGEKEAARRQAARREATRRWRR